MPAKPYRFAWRNNAAYVRTEDAASDWQVRAGNRAQLLFAALEAVGQIFIYSFTGTVFHAGAFQKNSGAVVFFGAPQSGKSSLGFADWKRNLNLIGDDRVVLVDEGRRIRPFPKCVKLRLDRDGVLPPGHRGAIARHGGESGFGP